MNDGANERAEVNLGDDRRNSEAFEDEPEIMNQVFAPLAKKPVPTDWSISRLKRPRDYSYDAGVKDNPRIPSISDKSIKCDVPISRWLLHLIQESKPDVDSFLKDVTLFGLSRASIPTEAIFIKSLRHSRFYHLAKRAEEPAKITTAIKNPDSLAEAKEAPEPSKNTSDNPQASIEPLHKHLPDDIMDHSRKASPAPAPPQEETQAAPLPKIKLKLTVRSQSETPKDTAKETSKESKKNEINSKPKAETPVQNGVASAAGLASNKPEVQENASDEINCICDMPDVDDGLFMIACDTCGFWFHGRCVGVMTAIDEWFCVRCTDYQ
ncbi:hypothetical protein HDU96_000278 [Phlyctochytrium bullatum]|nr:hypothetical protein HDU96_000278 [Phlyctochytrium bullatum]